MMTNKNAIAVSVDQSIIDNMKSVFNIDVIKEITDSIDQTEGPDAEVIITVTHNGDNLEN